MTSNRKAAFSRGDVMRRLDQHEDRLDRTETRRNLQSASIGAGGLRVLNGFIVILDAQGNEQMRLSSDGLSMEGLLTVLGDIVASAGGSVRVEGGGDFEIFGGGRFQALHVDGTVSASLGPVWDPALTQIEEDGLLVQSDQADGNLDILRAFHSRLDGLKSVFVGQSTAGVPNPIDDVVVRSNDVEINSYGTSDPDVLSLFSANRVFIESDGNAEIQTNTGTGNIFLDAGSAQVFVAHETVGSDDNCVISSGGLIRRVASARKYKQDIRELHVNPHAVLDLKPRTWRDRAEVERDPDTDRWHVGFIAEEVEEIGLGTFVNYDEHGEPSSLQYDRLTVALLETMKAQQTQIDALSAWAATQGYEAPAISAETTELPKRCAKPLQDSDRPRGRPSRELRDRAR